MEEWIEFEPIGFVEIIEELQKISSVEEALTPRLNERDSDIKSRPDFSL